MLAPRHTKAFWDLYRQYKLRIVVAGFGEAFRSAMQELNSSAHTRWKISLGIAFQMCRVKFSIAVFEALSQRLYFSLMIWPAVTWHLQAMPCDDTRHGECQGRDVKDEFWNSHLATKRHGSMIVQREVCGDATRLSWLVQILNATLLHNKKRKVQQQSLCSCACKGHCNRIHSAEVDANPADAEV